MAFKDLKTTLRQNVQNVDRNWYLIDAKGQTLGKIAAEIANKLRGKDRVDFTPHADGGAYVVVINAEQVAVSGQKETQKKYYRHSRFLGNLKEESLATVREKSPIRILRDAVSGMLPKNKLRPDQLRRLFLVVGENHKYEAQKPELITLK